MLLRQALAAVLLATGISAVPAGKSIIGYRTVNPREAIAIRAAPNAPVWDGQEAKGGKQLGAGVYTSTHPGAWVGQPGDWYCVIYASTTALHEVHKAWIPNFWTGHYKYIWWSDYYDIEEYIESLPGHKDPNKTLKLAWVSGMGTLLQMLIPPALIADQNMGFEAVCRESPDQLPDRVTVTYDGPDWEHNMSGERSNPDS